jgi:hypothetical protein
MRSKIQVVARRSARCTAAAMFGVLLGIGTIAGAQTPQPQTPPQTPPAQTPPPAGQPAQEAPQPPAKPQVTFDANTVLIFYTVLPDKTAQFEAVFGKVKDAMLQSKNPVRKQQAQGMRLLKSTVPAAQNSVLYALIVTPVMKDTEYSPGMLLFETFPTDAKTVFAELETAIKKDGLNGAIPLNPVLEFGGASSGM